MKRLIIFCGIFISLFAFGTNTTLANEGEIIDPETPVVLCLPGVYMDGEDNCSVMGPSGYLTDRAYLQAEVNSQEERYVLLGEEYGQLDYSYVKINSESERRLFRSLNEAIANNETINSFPKGFSYATYLDREIVDGKVYYRLTNGFWMRGGSTLGHVEPTLFRGVELSKPPERPFGWVLYTSNTYRSPGWNQLRSGNLTEKHSFIEVYDTIKIGSYNWYMIGPDEWVEQRRVALVFPASKPPKGVKNGRWIEINLFEQTTAVYENEEVIFATLTTSGSANYFTRPGLFKITEKYEITDMRGGVEKDGSDKYYLQDVPWTMYFDQRRAFHGEYWHDNLGFKSSHGCANLSFADAEWLFDWANLGDWVYIWDPSGLTPERPDLFTNLIFDMPRLDPKMFSLVH